MSEILNSQSKVWISSIARVSQNVIYFNPFNIESLSYRLNVKRVKTFFFFLICLIPNDCLWYVRGLQWVHTLLTPIPSRWLLCYMLLKGALVLCFLNVTTGLEDERDRIIWFRPAFDCYKGNQRSGEGQCESLEWPRFDSGNYVYCFVSCHQGVNSANIPIICDNRRICNV